MDNDEATKREDLFHKPSNEIYDAFKAKTKRSYSPPPQVAKKTAAKEKKIDLTSDEILEQDPDIIVQEDGKCRFIKFKPVGFRPHDVVACYVNPDGSIVLIYR